MSGTGRCVRPADLYRDGDGIVIDESPDLVAARRLLDLAKEHGFSFMRVAPGEDGPLWGERSTLEWADQIYIGGFSAGCSACRIRKSSLLVPSGSVVAERVSGNALEVLQAICEWRCD